MEAQEIFREEMRVLSYSGQKKTVIGRGRNSSMYAGIIGRKVINDASLLQLLTSSEMSVCECLSLCAASSLHRPSQSCCTQKEECVSAQRKKWTNAAEYLAHWQRAERNSGKQIGIRGCEGVVGIFGPRLDYQC